jgi:hypothetical protein
MITKMVITPKFNVHQWARTNLSRDWFEMQDVLVEMGRKLHTYMINYIQTHRKRSISGGNSITKVIQFHLLSTGPARIDWGIGDIKLLQSLTPYWYVLNYGKTIDGRRFIPGGEKWRPVRFGDNPADPELRGHGTQRATVFAPIGNGRTPSPIRPINYIQSTQFRMGNEIRRILAIIGKK